MASKIQASWFCSIGGIDVIHAQPALATRLINSMNNYNFVAPPIDTPTTKYGQCHKYAYLVKFVWHLWGTLFIFFEAKNVDEPSHVYSHLQCISCPYIATLWIYIVCES